MRTSAVAVSLRSHKHKDEALETAAEDLRYADCYRVPTFCRLADCHLKAEIYNKMLSDPESYARQKYFRLSPTRCIVNLPPTVRPFRPASRYKET